MSRLNEQLMRVIIGDIVTGSIAAGEMLPREQDLAEHFGVSRGVAREAIRGLEDRGFIVVKHGRGATVSDDSAWDVFDSDVLSVLLESERSASVLADYLECRRILEIEAAGLAAERATTINLNDLADAFARMRATAEGAVSNPAAEGFYHDADIAFHRLVIVAAGNRALVRMTAPIHRALARARRPLARPQVRMERSIPEHERILTTIAARDTDGARAAMRDHLLTVERYLREYAENAATSRGRSGQARGPVEG